MSTRPSDLIKDMFRVALILVVLLSVSACANNPVGLNGYEHLFAKIEQEGRIGVIVGLDGDWRDETELTQPERLQQRQAISDAQDALLAELVSYNASNISKYTVLPLLGVWIDAQALDFLIASPMVVSIEEDTSDTPDGN